ncbi:MAG: bifunctional (p)ppGpp synthetase/guanosine-3',5'-bis(diphosphate) 3'-pyrophosphohydrolase [Candidatus Saccharimonas sp.]|mgnify:FL=1|jgi:GTP diphosphokinase|nr:MAG: bifunctional (p)ppGpp synthetase/guanosine-3',5'-bis(diphosphate) 3'-pyrophosphohydrolase [Candidatus Saccharimonas sp.]
MEKAHIAEFEYDKHEIERALFFLSNALQDSGHNTKPVLLHSIQVAEMLWERGFPQDVVIAAVLHDVVEDTDITIDDVGQSFGHQVAVYVDALTVSDTQDIMQSFARTAELGSEALSIRAADLIQNSYYYHLASTDMQKRLRDKFVYFMELSGELLDEALVSELSKAYRRNVETI